MPTITTHNAEQKRAEVVAAILAGYSKLRPADQMTVLWLVFDLLEAQRRECGQAIVAH